MSEATFIDVCVAPVALGHGSMAPRISWPVCVGGMNVASSEGEVEVLASAVLHVVSSTVIFTPQSSLVPKVKISMGLSPDEDPIAWNPPNPVGYGTHLSMYRPEALSEKYRPSFTSGKASQEPTCQPDVSKSVATLWHGGENPSFCADPGYKRPFRAGKGRSTRCLRRWLAELAIVVVAFLASGYYLRGAIAFLAFCVFDAVGKDFLLDFGAFEGGLGVEQ